MDLEELRKEIYGRYGELDRRSGDLFLLSVLMEEVGELAEAVRKRELNAIREEIADVIFITLSLANYFGVEFEDRILEKYIKGDPSKKWDLRD